MPARSDAPLPPVLLADEPGSFPHGVLAERHPAIIRQVRDALPYGPERRRALDALLANCLDGVIEPLPADAHDRDRWTAWGADTHTGRSWFDVPWLWSESFFYRRLLDAVGYFTPGPWQGVDPFRPSKTAELDSPETGEELAALDALAGLPPAEQDRALLHGSLWGNAPTSASGWGPPATRPPPAPRPWWPTTATPSGRCCRPPARPPSA